LNVIFIYSLYTSKAQAGIGRGKGVGRSRALAIMTVSFRACRDWRKSWNGTVLKSWKVYHGMLEN